MKSHFKTYFLIYFFFIISALVVCFVYYIVRDFEYQEVLKSNKTEVLKRKDAIEVHLKENLSILKILQAYIQNNQEISREEFRRIVNPIIESNQSIQALEWIPRVSSIQREFFESNAEKEGMVQFFFKEYDTKGQIIRAKQRDFYFPVYYLEPLKSNENVLGFDISTYTFSKKNLSSAIKKFGFAFSSGLKLIQDSSEYGLVNYLPVFAINNESKKEIKGYLTGVYKTSVIIDHALLEFPKDIAILVYENSNLIGSKLLYSYIPSKSNVKLNNAYLNSLIKPKDFINEYVINLANFSWRLVFVSNHSNEFWSLSSVILAIGSLLVVFLTTILFLNKRKSISIAQFNQHLMKELTTRVQFEKELKLSEEKFSKLFYFAPIPITYIRLFDRTLVEINPAFERTFGYVKEGILGKTTFEIGMWLSEEKWNDYYNIFFQLGEIKYHETEVRTFDGALKTCLISGSLIRMHDQDYIYTFFQDISERKRAEVALHDSEMKYKDVFNLVNDGILISDLETGQIVDANSKIAEMHKYTIDELKCIDLALLSAGVYPYTYEELSKQFINSFNNNSSFLIEWQAKDKEGKLFWIEVSFKEAIIDNKKRILSVIRDISERKKVEKLLIENEFLFRFQFNNSILGIVIVSTDNLFIRANKKYCDILGYSEEELHGRPWTDFTYHEDFESEAILINQMLLGETEGYEKNKRLLKKDGSLAYVNISVSCFRNPDKSIYYIIAYIFDITDRMDMENKILKTIIETEESERNRFAQELHDGLGPLLSSIKMFTQWMLKPGANLDPNDTLRQIENLANMANQSVREVAFGLSPHILKDFGLVDALKSFIDKTRLNKNIPIEIRSSLTKRLEETTETILYRILIECINNTLKHSNANSIKINIIESEKYLDIEYQDDGVGFDLNDVTDKKFGMGLYNIQNRLKSINGKLLIFTQPGGGTLIKINILL